MKISVCMASFNGSQYINAQIKSILKQIRNSDEIIIVDDASSDNTVSIIKKFNSNQIKLFVNKKNIGISASFSQAMSLADGDIIFLSDQDDIWQSNKVSFILSLFRNSKIDLIVHDAILLFGNKISSKTLFEANQSRSGILKNIYRNTYTGCCMAFRRKVITKILPIPPNVGLFHDAWTGILSEYYGFNVKFIKKTLILFRRHNNNASSMKRRNIIKAIQDRVNFVCFLLKHVLVN